MMNNLIQSLDIEPVLNYVSKYTFLEVTKNHIFNLDFNTSLNRANYLQQLTNDAKEFLIRESYLDLKTLGNLNPLIKKIKIEGLALSPFEIIQFLLLLQNSKFLKQKFGKNSTLYLTLFNLVSNLFYDSLIEKEINNTVDENGEIKDSASPELRQLRQNIKQRKEVLQKVADKLLKKLSKDGLLQEEYFTLRDERLVLPVRTEFKRVVRGFIHDESSTGQTTYIEPEETLELNNEILSLKFQEKREIERILRLLTARLSVYSDDFDRTHLIISEIDEAFAKARYSLEIDGSKINFSTENFHLIQCRHPLLIKKLGFENCRPFSLKLDKKIKCLVISGPNAGGKTVFMKTIGVLVLLSKVGFQFPMHPDSQLPFFDDVFIDIGDEQSIESDISTFGSHINRIRNIYSESDKKSLILLDELGTGTDPNDGVALASGIIKALLEKESFVITTTHHSLLKHFASNHQQIINCSFEFDPISLNPTYNFIQGLPGSSYAFEIAERQNLDKKILKYSKEFLKKKDINAEMFISKLQNQVSEYENLLKQVKDREFILINEKKDLDKKISEITVKEKELKKNKLSQGYDYLKNSNSLIEKIIKEIKESNADSSVIKKAHSEIDDLKKKFQNELNYYSDTNSSDLKTGDFVKPLDSEIISKIIEIDNKRNFAIIQNGVIKLKIHIDKLKKVSKFNNDEHSAKTKIKNTLTNIQYRLDIRGKRVAELEFELIKYLDDISISGVGICEILHGKGDGILKNYVSEVLKDHPFVEKFYPAPIEIGGDGITIVKFKD